MKKERIDEESKRIREKLLEEKRRKEEEQNPRDKIKRRKKLPTAAIVDQNFLKVGIPYFGKRKKYYSMQIDGPNGPMVQTTGGVLYGYDYENIIHEYAFFGVENKEGACRFYLNQLREIRRLAKGGWQNQQLIESIKRQYTIVYWIGSWHDYLLNVDYPLGHFQFWENVRFPKPKDEDQRITLTPPIEILMNLMNKGNNILTLKRRDQFPDFITRRLWDILQEFHTLKQNCNFDTNYLLHLIPLIDTHPGRAKKKLFYHLDLIANAGEIDNWREDKDREDHIFTYKRHQSKWKQLIPEYKPRTEEMRKANIENERQRRKEAQERNYPSRGKSEPIRIGKIVKKSPIS